MVDGSPNGSFCDTQRATGGDPAVVDIVSDPSSADCQRIAVAPSSVRRSSLAPMTAATPSTCVTPAGHSSSTTPGLTVLPSDSNLSWAGAEQPNQPTHAEEASAATLERSLSDSNNGSGDATRLQSVVNSCQTTPSMKAATMRTPPDDMAVSTPEGGAAVAAAVVDPAHQRAAAIAEAALCSDEESPLRIAARADVSFDFHSDRLTGEPLPSCAVTPTPPLLVVRPIDHSHQHQHRRPAASGSNGLLPEQSLLDRCCAPAGAAVATTATTHAGGPPLAPTQFSLQSAVSRGDIPSSSSGAGASQSWLQAPLVQIGTPALPPSVARNPAARSHGRSISGGSTVSYGAASSQTFLRSLSPEPLVAFRAAIGAQAAPAAVYAVSTHAAAVHGQRDEARTATPPHHASPKMGLPSSSMSAAATPKKPPTQLSVIAEISRAMAKSERSAALNDIHGPTALAADWSALGDAGYASFVHPRDLPNVVTWPFVERITAPSAPLAAVAGPHWCPPTRRGGAPMQPQPLGSAISAPAANGGALPSVVVGVPPAAANAPSVSATAAAAAATVTLAIGQIPYIFDAACIARLLVELVVFSTAAGVDYGAAARAIVAVRPHERAKPSTANNAAVGNNTPVAGGVFGHAVQQQQQQPATRRCGLWFVEVDARAPAVLAALLGMHRRALVSDAAVYVSTAAPSSSGADVFTNWTMTRDAFIDFIMHEVPELRRDAHSKFHKGLGAVTIEECTTLRHSPGQHQSNRPSAHHQQRGSHQRFHSAPNPAAAFGYGQPFNASGNSSHQPWAGASSGAQPRSMNTFVKVGSLTPQATAFVRPASSALPHGGGHHGGATIVSGGGDVVDASSMWALASSSSSARAPIERVGLPPTNEW